jgi:hypothetical protein
MLELELRPYINEMDVRIGFSTQEGSLLSTFIRWITRSPCSHCWLLLDDPIRGQVVLSAESGSGFAETLWANWIPNNTVVGIYEPKVPLAAGVTAVQKLLGEQYATLGLIGMAWVYIGRWLHCKLRNPFRDKGELFCSEAVCIAMKAVNYPGTERMIPDDTSPEDLYALVTGDKQT